MIKNKKYYPGIILGLFFGLLIYFIQPTRWEGVELIKFGQIYQPLVQVSKGSQSTSDFSTVESISIVMERLKSTYFMKQVSKRTKEKNSEHYLDNNKCKCLTVKPFLGDDGMVLTMVGKSPDSISDSLNAIYEELRYQHHLILTPYFKSVKSNNLAIESEIEDIKNSINLIDKSIRSGANSNHDSLTTLIFIFDLRRELQDKQNKSNENKLTISSFDNMETQLIEPISLKEKRIFPSLFLTCLLGIFLGLFFSIVWFKFKL